MGPILSSGLELGARAGNLLKSALTLQGCEGHVEKVMPPHHPVACGYYPDFEVKHHSFYRWQSDLDVKFGGASVLRVGQRKQYPQDEGRDYLRNPFGIVVRQSTVGIASSWPGRLFRLGEVKGLRRMSFTGGSPDVGWCKSYVIVEAQQEAAIYDARPADAPQYLKVVSPIEAELFSRPFDSAGKLPVGTVLRYEHCEARFFHENGGWSSLSHRCRVMAGPETMLGQKIMLHTYGGFDMTNTKYEEEPFPPASLVPCAAEGVAIAAAS